MFLSSPMLLSERTDKTTGQSAMVLSRFLPFAADTAQVLPIAKDHIISMSRVFDELQQYYWNALDYNERNVQPKIKEEINRVNELMNQSLDKDLIKIKESVPEDVVIEFIDEEGMTEEEWNLFTLKPASTSVH